MQKRLGVLITYHNEGPLLTDCLTSLTQNTDRPDEIWIYDDASEVAPDGYVPAGLDIRIVRGADNRGESAARNALLQRCACDYVHFQDADDLFDSAWCSAIRQSIDCHTPDVIFTDISLFRDGGLVCREFHQLHRLSTQGDLLRFSIRNGFGTPSGTYLREKLELIGGYNEALWLANDYDFHIRFATLKPQFRLICEPLIKVRMREGSHSSSRQRVCSYSAKCLTGLRGQLSPEYQQDVSEKLALLGAELYQLGAPQEAAKAFAASLEIVRPRYEGHGLHYRIIATLMGQAVAELCRRYVLAALPPKARGRWKRFSIS